MTHKPWAPLRALLIIVALLSVPAQPAEGQTETPAPPSEAQPDPWDPLFDDTVLHEIRLTINTRAWASLKEHYLEDTYYPANFQWNGQTVRNVGIRSRGTGSRSGIKPGLRVDFDRYSTSQKLLGLKSLVLRNNTQDSSSLRERISMRLFKRMGLAAPLEAHAKLYVNNSYAGLYSIVQSIDKTFLKDTFGEDEGYLYKYDYPADAQPYYFENRGADPSLYVPLPFQPETHEDDPHAEVIERLVWTINETSDGAFRTAIAEFLDLDRFLAHVAVEVFLAESDGFLGNWAMNNYYLYRFTDRNLFTMIPWDKSHAFVDGFASSIWHYITDREPQEQNRLMKRVLSFADLRERYLDHLMNVVRSASEIAEGQSQGPGWLEREVQREYEQVRDAALADSEKPYSNEEFERAVTELGAFARHRAESVSREVAESRPR